MTHAQLEGWFKREFPELNLLAVVMTEGGVVEFRLREGPDYRSLGTPADNPKFREERAKLWAEEKEILDKFKELSLRDLAYGICYRVDWAERYG